MSKRKLAAEAKAAAAATPPAPLPPDPGPELALADVPGMPATVAAHLVELGIRTLANLRPLVESKATVDPTCEPVFAVLHERAERLTLIEKYKAGDALTAVLGPRAHMLAVMAGWPRPVAAPAAGDDFDEDTPPPRGRPQGEPVANYVVLPPGEPVPELFARWDREGRIPQGCLLAVMVGGVTATLGTTSGWRLVATVKEQVETNEQMPFDVLAKYYPRVSIVARAGKFPEVPRNFVVFAPGGRRMR